MWCFNALLFYFMRVQNFKHFCCISCSKKYIFLIGESFKFKTLTGNECVESISWCWMVSEARERWSYKFVKHCILHFRVTTGQTFTVFILKNKINVFNFNFTIQTPKKRRKIFRSLFGPRMIRTISQPCPTHPIRGERTHRIHLLASNPCLDLSLSEQRDLANGVFAPREIFAHPAFCTWKHDSYR